MDYIYEIMDSTNDEMYYSQGVFATLEEAVRHVTTEPCFDDADDYCENTIRQRQLGNLTSGVGKVVYLVLWEYDYESHEWIIKEQEAIDYKIDAAQKEEVK